MPVRIPEAMRISTRCSVPWLQFATCSMQPPRTGGIFMVETEYGALFDFVIPCGQYGPGATVHPDAIGRL